ncbi:MAG TPA: LysR family transcriptional regulator [Acidimicrobiales bacterium]|nr:LysR family transcriptional regulator [Acidimicrobiales bacterium]
MTLDDLRILVAACEAGSLSAVARQLGRSQPAVSQHIRRLERELDIALVERSRRGIAPTAAGRILLAAATDALGALDAGRREVDRLREGDHGSLRVATGGPTLRHFMTGPLAEFRTRHPSVAFDYVSATSTRQCLDAVRADHADLAFVTLAGDEELERRPTLRTRWVLVVAADHPRAGAATLRPAELRDLHPIGMPGHTTSRMELEDELAARGVRLRYSTTVDDWDTAVQLVELGVGESIVPALWVHDLVARPRLRAIGIEGIRPLTFGWAARRWDALPPFADAFVTLVDEGFARLDPAAQAELLPGRQGGDAARHGALRDASSAPAPAQPRSGGDSVRHEH